MNLEKLTRITDEIRRAGDSGSDTEGGGAEVESDRVEGDHDEIDDDDGWDTRTVRGREIEG